MVTFSYRTIQSPAQGLYKEKGSKFLAFAYPVATEEDVRKHIMGLKEEYFDARHHGYAYILGPNKDKYRAFDDGEPSHSTGDPILGQLKSRNLTNILVVVVRYFGGVKLGVGGLVAAYRTAADAALSNAVIIEKDVTAGYILSYGYESMPAVMRMVKDFELKIIEEKFGQGGQMRVEIKLKQQDAFLEKTQLLISMGMEIRIEENIIH